MADGMEAACKKKTQLKETEIENLKKSEAEAEAYAMMLMKDEYYKEIEREKHKK